MVGFIRLRYKNYDLHVLVQKMDDSTISTLPDHGLASRAGSFSVLIGDSVHSHSGDKLLCLC